MAEGDALVVTDGTDSFYGSQKVVQYMYESGAFAKITAFSSSAADAKKMLLTREARYSGLLDKLHMAEGGMAELATVFGDATVWVAVNANETTLLDEVAAASRGGVKRAFIHIASTGSLDTGALTSALASSGMEYTLMRTGELAAAGAGGGLILSDLDLPTCEEVPKEDVFRFAAEAVTLDAAAGRSFSLCAAADASMLKEMRRAGCTRREEVEALLTGKIVEKAEEAPVEASEEDPAERTRTPEEEKDYEEEIRRLSQKAAERGRKQQELMKQQEEEKKIARAELAAKYSRLTEGSDGDKDKDGGDAAEDEPESPKKDDDGGLAVM